MLAAALDRWLWRTAPPPAHPQTRMLHTAQSELRVRDSGGAGPALVFFCDPPVVVEAYDRLIAELQPDYRVLVVELPGFGFSSARSAQATGFTGTVAAVEAALQVLNLPACVLCGPCICGFVAAELVRRGRLPVRGLVLMQTPDVAGMRAWTERMDPRRLLRTPLLGQLIVRATAARLTRFWLRYATARDYDAAPLTAQCLAALRGGGGYPLAGMLQSWGAELSDAPLPIAALAVWGRQDRSHQDTPRQSTCRHVPGARQMEFEHCGHFSELEDPAGFAAALRPVLQGWLQPAQAKK